MSGIVVLYALKPAAIIMKVFSVEISISVVLHDLAELSGSFVDADMNDSILNKPGQLQTNP